MGGIVLDNILASAPPQMVNIEWDLAPPVAFVSRPIVYFTDYPPLPDETTEQYLFRVRPLVWADMTSPRRWWQFWRR